MRFPFLVVKFDGEKERRQFNQLRWLSFFLQKSLSVTRVDHLAHDIIIKLSIQRVGTVMEEYRINFGKRFYFKVLKL